MLEILFMGAFTAAAFILIMAKGNIRRWLHNAVYIDIGAFIAMTLLFEGTFSGMVSAMVGGVMFSLALEVLKYFYGTEELTLQGWKRNPSKYEIDRAQKERERKYAYQDSSSGSRDRESAVSGLETRPQRKNVNVNNLGSKFSDFLDTLEKEFSYDPDVPYEFKPKKRK